jgi:hypothetical protein
MSLILVFRLLLRAFKKKRCSYQSLSRIFRTHWTIASLIFFKVLLVGLVLLFWRLIAFCWFIQNRLYSWSLEAFPSVLLTFCLTETDLMVVLQTKVLCWRNHRLYHCNTWIWLLSWFINLFDRSYHRITYSMMMMMTRQSLLKLNIENLSFLVVCLTFDFIYDARFSSSRLTRVTNWFRSLTTDTFLNWFLLPWFRFAWADPLYRLTSTFDWRIAHAPFIRFWITCALSRLITLLFWI